MITKRVKKESGGQTGALLLLHSLGGIVGSLFGGLIFDWTGSYQLLISFNIAFCALTVGMFLYGSSAGKQKSQPICSA